MFSCRASLLPDQPPSSANLTNPADSRPSARPSSGSTLGGSRHSHGGVRSRASFRSSVMSIMPTIGDEGTEEQQKVDVHQSAGTSRKPLSPSSRLSHRGSSSALMPSGLPPTTAALRRIVRRASEVTPSRYAAVVAMNRAPLRRVATGIVPLADAEAHPQSEERADDSGLLGHAPNNPYASVEANVIVGLTSRGAASSRLPPTDEMNMLGPPADDRGSTVSVGAGDGTRATSGSVPDGVRPSASSSVGHMSSGRRSRINLGGTSSGGVLNPEGRDLPGPLIAKRAKAGDVASEEGGGGGGGGGGEGSDILPSQGPPQPAEGGDPSLPFDLGGVAVAGAPASAVLEAHSRRSSRRTSRATSRGSSLMLGREGGGVGTKQPNSRSSGGDGNGLNSGGGGSILLTLANLPQAILDNDMCLLVWKVRA